MQNKPEGKKCWGCPKPLPKPNYISVGNTITNIICYILKHTKKDTTHKGLKEKFQKHSKHRLSFFAFKGSKLTWSAVALSVFFQ